jgi:hypothetical protein
MPSVLAGQPFASGPQLLVSGCFWSGQATSPQGGVLVVVDREASGSIYIGFSGSLTYKSGAGYLTGGGLNDGVQLGPGQNRFIPRLMLPNSGTINIYFWTDAAASGQARVYWEKM